MSAHSIICRLGNVDAEAITLARKDSVSTEVSFIPGATRLDFGLGQALDRIAGMGFQPSEVAIDLAILSATMTAADTRINRASEALDNWTREIDLYVPVLDVALWKTNAQRLERMMNFLTGDRWRLYLRPRPTGLKELATKPTKLSIEQPSCVCLFSGGLDSFIGAIDLIAAGENPLLVSHYWDSVTSDHQNYCAERIEKEIGRKPMHIRARVGFPSTLVGKKTENSLRGRSFMFFALAALAANAIGKQTIYVPENGLISLNVPLDPMRIGALSTRTTHPYYMARWNELLKALGIDAKLENSYRHLTKGEMVRGCKNQKFLKQYAAVTMSCSSPAKGRWLGEPPMHCGHCVPCIIRRAALLEGHGIDMTEYRLKNLKACALDSNKAEGEHVRAFQRAIERLRRKPSLAQFDIHLPGPLNDYPGDWTLYQAVYSNGLQEINRLLMGVVTKPQ